MISLERLPTLFPGSYSVLWNWKSAASTMDSIINIWADCLNLAYSNWPEKYKSKQSDKTFVLSLSKKEEIEPWWNYCSTITVYDWHIITQTHFGWFTYIFVISGTKNMVCKCLPKISQHKKHCEIINCPLHFLKVICKCLPKISQHKKHCEIINCPLHFLKVKTFWLFCT